MKLILSLLLIANGLMLITMSSISIYRSLVTIPMIKKEAYKSGYNKAKQIYESQDFEYTEEKLLNEE